MTYDVSHLTQDLPVEEDGGIGPSTKSPSFPTDALSRADSIDSISGELNLPCCYSSDDLDKLSNCLSEVSSDSGKTTSSSLFYDIIQAQLALWTCVFSLLYSYAWNQHRKKFLLSIFFVVPTVFTICCVISTLLTTIVVLGRIFSTPIAYKEFLNMGDNVSYQDQDFTDFGTMRQRSYSGASDLSEDCLPRPLCRRHSSSQGSLSRPPSVNRKLSYRFSHNYDPVDNTN